MFPTCVQPVSMLTYANKSKTEAQVIGNVYSQAVS